MVKYYVNPAPETTGLTPKKEGQTLLFDIKFNQTKKSGTILYPTKKRHRNRCLKLNYVLTFRITSLFPKPF